VSDGAALSDTASVEFEPAEWVYSENFEGCADSTCGGTFQDYRGFQQYWEFRVEDDFAGRGTTIHNWMSERPPSEWTVFTIVRDGTTLTFQGDGRTRTATVDEDWGDNLRILRLRSHYSSNCDPSTVVKIDNIEIRLGQTHL
jgi:hypothetical protein